MRWSDLPPDAKPSLLSELTPQLGFVDAIRLIMNRGGMPMVMLRADAATQVWQHARSQSVELGGLLIGRMFSDGAGQVRAVEIVHAVPSRSFHSTSVSLSMGALVWQEAAAYRSDNLHVVGWYHTHPNLGAFFSGTDRTTQRNFFKESYSLGLVVDPIRNEEAWFVGADSRELPPNHVHQRQ